MKEIYLLRHGEKDGDGVLTERGKQAARDLRGRMPAFALIISSPSDRTVMTANLLTGSEPKTDPRAAYATTPADVSARIAAIASEHGIAFLDAARQDNDAEVLRGIDEQAVVLNELVDDVLHNQLGEDERALIVSHDLTIVPAMAARGMANESIGPLSGYVISLAEGMTSVREYNAAI